MNTSASPAGTGVTAVALNATTGIAESIVGTIANIGSPTALCLAADGSFLYVTDSSSHTVVIYSVDRATGAISLASTPTVPAGTSPTSLALHPNEDILYVCNFGSADIWAFRIDRATGIPSRFSVAPGSGRGSPVGVTVHPSGKFLYLSEDEQGCVSTYTIGADGSLALADSMALVSDFPGPVSIDPSGRFAFFSQYQDSSLRVVPIDPQTGILIEPATRLIRMPPPFNYVRLAFHPQRPDCVYATVGNQDVGQFTLDAATGDLALVRRVTVASAQTLDAVRVDASGKRLYACDSSSAEMHTFSCDEATGQLTYQGAGEAGELPSDFVLFDGWNS
ncbi:lactonase family protein [Ramlibacter humi]|nr:beta-propeller fold lactonase family protein [Ramlibacter humi]